MSLAGILLGLINIGIWAAFASIIVLLIIYGTQWFFSATVPDRIQKLMWAIVGLIVLGMLVGLLVGSPPPMLFHSFR